MFGSTHWNSQILRAAFLLKCQQKNAHNFAPVEDWKTSQPCFFVQKVSEIPRDSWNYEIASDHSGPVIVTLIQMLILSNPSITNKLSKQPSGTKSKLGTRNFLLEFRQDTVDGRNPTPPEMYKTLKCIKRWPTHQLVQDFFHQVFPMVFTHLHSLGTHFRMTSKQVFWFESAKGEV